VNYLENSLTNGEILRYETQLHWIALVVPYTIAVDCLLAGVFCIINSIGPDFRVGLLFVLSAAYVFGLAYASRNASDFVVTNKRVIMKVGILNERSLELLLNNVDSISVAQNWLGKVLGYGTIVVEGISGTTESFDRVPRPIDFRREVLQQKDNVGVPATAKARVPAVGRVYGHRRSLSGS